MPRPLRGQGPLDPPGKIATTLSQLALKKTMGTPCLPPIGFERHFKRKSRIIDGGGDESLEVGVLKYKEGPGIVTVSVEIDAEVLVGRDRSCTIQLYGASVSNFHLRFYAVHTSSPLAIVCMNDISSTTGYILNGKLFPPSASYKLGEKRIGSRMIVLKDGDEIQVPGTPQVLRYKHNSFHYPIEPSYNEHIEGYALFSTTLSNHYINTNAWQIHNYPLGHGTFGVVNLATHKLGGVQAAIKTIDSRSGGSDRWRERVSEEVGNMKKLNHPNVMKVLDKVKDTGAKVNKQEEEGQDEDDQYWDWESVGVWKAHIVFELATGGDLFSYLESCQGLSEDETKFLGWQLVLGLDHLHVNNVAHRDFKLENILLHNRNSFPRLLIGDFGFSTTLESMVEQVPKTGGSFRTQEPAGTIINFPPERLKSFSRPVKTGGLGESLHGDRRRAEIGGKWFEEEKQLDIWGLGVVIYQLISVHHPYAAADDAKSKSSIFPTRSEMRAKGRPRKETQETKDQFPTQEESSSRSKRKVEELEIESEEDEDYTVQPPSNSKSWVGYSGIGKQDKYAVRPAGYSWDDYRKTHGEGTVGGSDSETMRAASRALEDIKAFVERPPDVWLPVEKWDVVSPGCRAFINQLLQMRVYQRMTISQAKDHDWFISSQEDLDLLYQQVVIRGVHAAGPA